MLWEVEIRPSAGETDFEGQRVLESAHNLGITSLRTVQAARVFLLQGELTEADLHAAAQLLLADPVTEVFLVRRLYPDPVAAELEDNRQLNVLFLPGVTDSVAENALKAMKRAGFQADHVATGRRIRVNSCIAETELQQLSRRVLSNEAIEHVVSGTLEMQDLSLGSSYELSLTTVAIRGMNAEQLAELSVKGQLYLSPAEMETVQQHFVQLDRDPTDIELETIAQTWSEHCSHKTLAGRIHYEERQNGQCVSERSFNNMLKETIFAATVSIREAAGDDDWCVSVFKDNAGIVRFDDRQNVCIKVETHNHPSAIEPYGGANTGLGGVIRDPLGTGLGARPVCSTDVFCFARPDYPAAELPPGVLHPLAVMQGVVAGVRDYGNRMGIPTVNGAVCFDDRYLGNPLVYCGNVAMMPREACDKQVNPGDLIVAVGGRTGRDGIHGATFSSVELTEESESISGGAVQIGNPVTEKMVLDVILAARDRGLYTAITDCGAGGFSSAVGEMGEETGAEVWLEQAPLKYSGLSYTEIWISEAQERMVLSVPPGNWDEFRELCESEGVEATAIGRFTDTQQLVLTYDGTEVGRLSMSFLHDGRPPVVRRAVYEIQTEATAVTAEQSEVLSAANFGASLKGVLGSLNVASKEWIIRQYDHEVQAGSVIKPLTGADNDGPSDAAVVRPDLHSMRGLVVSSGINPCLGDLDPYWMAAAAIDESVRNCVATGADPDRIAILDNFCWGNTERAETLGTLVRAAIGCQDVAMAYGTPFVSGKDSLNNEFSFEDPDGQRTTVAIPSTLLITALGQVENVEQCVTMDLKQPGNLLFLVGRTGDELGGSHLYRVEGIAGGHVPRVEKNTAPQIFRAVHTAIRRGLIQSCHDLSEGGLAVAAAEMAFAGRVGARLQLDAMVARDLAHLPQEIQAGVALFAESCTRFVIEVASEHASEVTELFGNLPLAEIGRTTSDQQFHVELRAAGVISESLTELKEAWQSPLRY